MNVIGKWIKSPLNWNVLPPSISNESEFGSLKIDSPDSKQQIEMIFEQPNEISNLISKLKRLQELKGNKDRVGKLCDERFSLWVKLLKESPEDVPQSLHTEFKVLLKLMGVITSKDLGEDDTDKITERESKV